MLLAILTAKKSFFSHSLFVAPAQLPPHRLSSEQDIAKAAGADPANDVVAVKDLSFGH
jgi:hypothetical protein